MRSPSTGHQEVTKQYNFVITYDTLCQIVLGWYCNFNQRTCVNLTLDHQIMTTR